MPVQHYNGGFIRGKGSKCRNFGASLSQDGIVANLFDKMEYKLRLKLIILVGIVLALGSALHARAQTFQYAVNDPYRDTINGQCYKARNPFYPSYRGQCTWYVYGRCLENGWTLNYTGNANDWYARLTNGSAKDMTPTVGSIMCIKGHVAYVSSVAADKRSWVVDEYNFYPAWKQQWDEETITQGPTAHTVICTAYRGTFDLYGFIHPPLLPNGLYKASNENRVFLVTNGGRRAIPSSDCFNDWHLNWNALRVVSEGQLYTETSWQPPIEHLVKMAGSSSVYWIVQLVSNQPLDNHFFARPIANPYVFNHMGFRWSDIQTVPYNPIAKYQNAGLLTDVVPNLVVRDGPYEITNGGNYFSGYRVKNLSDSARYGFATTIRAYRTTDSYWFDFGWDGNGGLDPALTDGWSPNWKSIPIRWGSYRMQVICSYVDWTGNVQEVLPGGGDFPYPLTRNYFSSF